MNILLLARESNCLSADTNREPFCRIVSAYQWVVGQDMNKWPYEQLEKFDNERILPLLLAGQRLGMVNLNQVEMANDNVSHQLSKPLFDPHDAIKPYWNINACL